MGMRTRLTDRFRGEAPLKSFVARYGFAFLTVAGALVLRLLLAPLTGRGGVFALLFVAVILTTLIAGVGPAIVSLVVGVVAAMDVFMIPTGMSLSRIVVQSLLYGLTGLIIIYLAYLTSKRRQTLLSSNERLASVNAERMRLLHDERLARKETQAINAELRESEERFRLTIENAPIGMALVGLDGKFERVNQRFCEITGYEPDELTKLTFQDITHPDDLDTDVELATRLARERSRAISSRSATSERMDPSST